MSEDVPVPGGTAGVARALGLDSSPEPARFVAEIGRLLYNIAEPKYGMRAALLAALERATHDPKAPADLVPIPLTEAVWSEAIFRRPIGRQAIVGAILADRSAALLCRGLAALDDETLRFLIDRPAVLARLYERSAAAFAAFGGGIRVSGDALVVPGGPAAAALWQAAVLESPSRAERFIPLLFEAADGRMAYLYDTIAQLDRPRAAFALGLWIRDERVRVERFKALAAINATAYGEWDVKQLPFVRPMNDVATLLLRTHATAQGFAAAPASRAFWSRVFDGDEVPETDALLPKPGVDEEPVDAAWLAAEISSHSLTERTERLEQFAFVQRVFGASPDSARGQLFVAARAYRSCRMLMLTLERIGLRDPRTFVSAARQAVRLGALDGPRASTALAQFQGALALVARMTAARSLAVADADLLVGSVVAVPLVDGAYGGAMGRWIERELLARIPRDIDVEHTVVAALAGAGTRATTAVHVSWEGEEYRLDVAAAEGRRLERIRRKQGGPRLDAALALSGAKADAALAEVLLSFAYAIDLGDPDGTALLAGNVALRHDFGVDIRERRGRTKAAWAAPRQQIAPATPWHVTGSLLGLDGPLASLALRRLESDRIGPAPAVTSTERDTFALTVAMMNPLALRDTDRDAIAAAIDRGRLRVERARARDAAQMDALAEGVGMDGWRRRALAWTVAHHPADALSLFSLAELLEVGGGAGDADLDAWGMAAVDAVGCTCTRFVAPRWWPMLAGRPRLGSMVAAVPDLNLHVAVTLRDLGLPAALARDVLAAAMQDFIDEARPTDGGDWLTLVRAARTASRERIEDYVAAVTADGALVPQGTDPQR